MKALTLIDQLNQIVNTKLADSQLRLALITVNEIYSTPFKPELIVKMFKDWARLGSGRVMHIQGDLVLQLYPRHNNSAMFDLKINSTDEGLFYLRTIDEFITFGDNNNIQLTWKPEYAKKLKI